MLDVGERIRLVREQRGLSRKAFGAAIGVTEAKVQAIEVGRQRIDHEVLVSLSRSLGVDANWLLLGDTTSTEAGLPNAGLARPDDAQFVPVTRFAVEASAGHGSLVQDETGSGTYAYNKVFLDRRGLKSDNLAVIGVKGDSMSPDLNDGDLILIDRAETEPDALREGAIYVVQYDNGLFVKRIQRAPGQRLLLASANPTYAPIIVEGEDLDGVKIIGRVVNSTREW